MTDNSPKSPCCNAAIRYTQPSPDKLYFFCKKCDQELSTETLQPVNVLHQCKYCKALTTCNDEDCYMAPPK